MPYPYDVANGIAFSSDKGITPSLAKIQTGLQKMFEVDVPMQYDLLNWQQQGVMLLNAALTVIKGKPNSHSELWKPFVSETIKTLNLLPKPIVFILFGARARDNYMKLIDQARHNVILVEHPAAASYEQRDWIHDNCFIKANDLLESRNEKSIKWISEPRAKK